MRTHPISRRTLLKQAALAAAVCTSTNVSASSFPPQSVIDHDPLRPRYHLMPHRGWMNDPCAPLYYEGKYHMFFQYNPGASVWGDMHWAHATSSDMIHWQQGGIALSPSPDLPDAAGVFTGSVLFDNGKPKVLYTGVSEVAPDRATIWDSHPPLREQQMLAIPLDQTLTSWQKQPQAVISNPPPGMKVTGFRDPTPFRVGNNWYLLLASGEKGVGGKLLLYKAGESLSEWDFQAVFEQGELHSAITQNSNSSTDSVQSADTVDTGETWECPDFFQLKDKWLLIHSTGTPQGRMTVWQSGSVAIGVEVLGAPTRESMIWAPEQSGILDRGSYYAPKTQLDKGGNRILWGWITETRLASEYGKAGWAGCMSLPRILTLENAKLHYEPAPQVTSLRGPAMDPNHLPADSRTQHELVLTVSHQSQRTPANFTALGIAITTGSNLQVNNHAIPEAADLPKQFEIRCFRDHSVLEIFIGRLAVFTTRLYTPEQAASMTLPAGYAITNATAYPMNSI